ncbi:MAG: tail fiber domain-containing protein [Bacteroidetes bacterium]|nr:tail fiber domain-containing protein [Bacteroidota bacterium]
MGAAGSSYTPYGVIGVSNAYVYTGSDLAIATDGANVIKFATGAGIPERMRIDSAGRVGIGTASPATALQVVGTGTFGNGVGGRLQVTTDSNLSYIDSLNNAATQWQPLVERATEIQFHTNTAGVTPAQKAVIDSSGRLLVGLSSTSAATGVVVQGNSAGAGSSGIQYFCFDGATPANNDGLGYLIFGDNTQARGAWIAGVRDGGTWSASSNPSRLEFSTTADGASSPTERMRIGQNGNVNIGRTSDLTVAPRVSIENSNYALALNTTNGGSNEAVRFYNAGTAVGTISTNGSATAYNTSSDYRLKENIVPLTNAVNRLNQLQVHRFNFIADSDKTVDGFIAHEAQAVVPECVTGTKDEVDADGNPIYQGIDQSKLVPLLTAALQEALAEIESLKARVTALEP